MSKSKEHEENKIIQNIKPSSPKLFTLPPIRVAKSLYDTFQTTQYTNTPPHPNKTKHVQLITIGPSHFCEKVRWGLDLLENDVNSNVYYTEDAHPPLFHAFATIEASGGKASMTPMIVSDNDFLVDSTAILKQLCPFLYRMEDQDQSLNKEIESLETYLNQEIGASIRNLIYYEYFTNPKYHPYLIQTLSSQTSIIESLLFSKMFHIPKYGIMQNMTRSLQINERNAEISQESILKAFHLISNRLDGGKEYVVGDRFTAVDLTFASLAGILLLPKEKGRLNFEEGHLTPRLMLLRKELLGTVGEILYLRKM